jgi:hypothetical protein
MIMCTAAAAATLLAAMITTAAGAVNRRALVARHSPRISCATLSDPECSGLNFQTLGNGDFAFSADVTGLQTFNHSISVAHPGAGDEKVLDSPVNTMSNWGWHITPVEKSTTPQANVSTWQNQEITSYGHQSAYPTGCGGPFEGDAASCPAGQKQPAYGYLRANPHRLNLGRLFLASNHTTMADLRSKITDVSQSLDMWSGLLSSNFSLSGQRVQVMTAVGTTDTVAVRIRSELLLRGGLHLQLAFPYGSESFSGDGADWQRPQDHTSTLSVTPAPAPAGGGGVHAVIQRQLDATHYSVLVCVEGAGSLVVAGAQPHSFEIRAAAGALELKVTVTFTPSADKQVSANAATTFAQSAAAWEQFWMSGAAIEFHGSTDPRAALLEKQVVMSMYMMRSQEAGSLPPQETGLTTNSWSASSTERCACGTKLGSWHGVTQKSSLAPPTFTWSCWTKPRTTPSCKGFAVRAGSRCERSARWKSSPGPAPRARCCCRSSRTRSSTRSCSGELPTPARRARLRWQNTASWCKRPQISWHRLCSCLRARRPVAV